MASKERELLKRVVKVFDSVYSADLIDEIEELLAQPEQDKVQYLLDQVSRLFAENAMLKEKWSTPKPEQAPVAWMNESGGCFLSDGNKYSDLWTPLYTSPPKREPLGNETIAKLWGDKYSGKTFMVRNFARAIEKAHGIGETNE